jgi:DinB family protein
MEDLKAAAWMLRYGARSLAHNLEFIPADRIDWRPDPAAKSPLEVAAEVIRALHLYRPIFEGPEYPDLRPPIPQPETLEAARSLLLDAVEDYAAALERAGPELDRPQVMPFGGTFRAYRAVCFPLMDLFHHHGQICYLQSLLGDREMHWSEAAIADVFAWKVEEASGE